MSTTTYYSIANPPGFALPDQGPGVPSLPVSNPIGAGVVVAASSTAAANFELRVTTVSDAAGASWTTNEIIMALEKMKQFIRQRGFILGSGGPGNVAGTSGGVQPQTIPIGNVPI